MGGGGGVSCGTYNFVVVFFEVVGVGYGQFCCVYVSLVHLHNRETCSPMVKRKREESEFV